MRRKFKHTGFVDVRGSDTGRIRGEASVWLPDSRSRAPVLTVEGRCITSEPEAAGRALDLAIGDRVIGSIETNGTGDFAQDFPLPIDLPANAVLKLRAPASAKKRRTLAERIRRTKLEAPALFRGDVQIRRITLDGKILVDFTAGAATFKGHHPTPGLNIIGFFDHGFGIGESARCCARAARAAGLAVALNRVKIGTDNTAAESPPGFALSDSSPHPFNVFHLDPPQMQFVDEFHGPALRAGRYNIGYWAWELPEFPDFWLENFNLIDEVWVPSHFVRESIAAKSPVPVMVMPHAIDPAVPVASTRQQFGLAADHFLFLTIFDFNSSLPRKNPLAAIAAFRNAFPTEGEVRLVVKTQNSAAHAADFEAVRLAIGNAANITVIDRTMPRAELAALQAVCDCFVSLHRSEGFGLALAEAMQLGKPVIATNWSGNLEFMTASDSCLVDYDLVQLAETHGPYKRGQWWAEPNVRHAAFWMRRIFEEPEARERIAANAQRSVREKLAASRIGGLYAARLNTLSHWF